MVNSVTLDPASLIEAMENGRFYSSSGVRLEKYMISSQRISFDVIQEEGIRYMIQWIGIKGDAEKASILKEQTGTHGEYVFEGDELFVRAKIISNKLKIDPYQVGEYETAWTQPVSPVK